MYTSKFTLYVPTSRKQVDEVALAVQDFTKAAGGMTMQMAAGVWYDKDKAVKDDLVLMSWWVSSVEEFRGYAVAAIVALHNAGEKSVLIEVTKDGVTSAEMHESKYAEWEVPAWIP